MLKPWTRLHTPHHDQTLLLPSCPASIHLVIPHHASFFYLYLSLSSQPLRARF